MEVFQSIEQEKMDVKNHIANTGSCISGAYFVPNY
jgi:hypothetical protein